VKEVCVRSSQLNRMQLMDNEVEVSSRMQNER
jgi:hypothetical protein